MTTTSARLTNTLARGTGVNLLGFLVRTALVFLHSILAARFYGADAYGQYAVGFAMVMLLSSISQLGLSQTLIRFVASELASQHSNHLWPLLKLSLKITLPVTLLITAVMLVWSGPVAQLFGEPALTATIPVFAFALPVLTLMTLFSSFTQGFKRMRYKTLALDLIRPGVEVLGVSIIATLGYEQSSLPLAIAYAVSVLVATITLLYFISTSLLPSCTEHHAGAEDTDDLSHRVLRFSFRVWLLDLLSSTIQRSSFLLLGALGTSTMVGIFAILQRLNSFGIVFLISTNLIFAPIVADLTSQRETSEFERLYKLSTRWIFIVSLPLFVLMAFYGKELLAIFGPKFVQGYGPFLILIAAGLVNVATGSNVILTMAGYPHYSAINQVINLVTMVGISFWMIPNYGLFGGVLGVASGLLIASILQLFEIWFHFRVHPYNVGFLKVVVAGICLLLTLLIPQSILSGTGWIANALTVIAALTFYFVTLFALGLSEEEQTVQRAMWQRFSALLNSEHQHRSA